VRESFTPFHQKNQVNSAVLLSNMTYTPFWIALVAEIADDTASETWSFYKQQSTQKELLKITYQSINQINIRLFDVKVISQLSKRN